MTERTISLLVTLDKEYRVDDAEYIVNAIKMIKGVLDVNTNIFKDLSHMEKWSMKRQLKNEMFKKINDFFEVTE